MTSNRVHEDPPTTRTVRAVDFGRLLVGGAPFALGLTLLAVLGAVLVTRNSPPVYRASVTMVAPRSVATPGGLDVVAPAAIDPGVYRSAVFDGGVLLDAASAIEGRALGEVELERIERSVRVSVEDQDLSSTLRIEARANSPQGAADLANGIARGLVAWDRERARQVIEGSVNALELALASIDEQLAGTTQPPLTDAQRASLTQLRAQRLTALQEAQALAAAAVPVGLIASLRAADAPERSVGPRMVLNTSIAFVLALVVGYALVLLRWTTSPRIADAGDLEHASGFPVLATFPRRAQGAPRLSEEAASLLQTRVTAMQEPERCLVVVVATPRATRDQEGVAVGLAESCARSGIATLLVDADLRAARSTAWLEVNTTRTTPYDDAHLDDHKSRFEPVTVIVEGKRSFDFVPAFAPARYPVDRVSRVLRDHLSDWTQRYDVIVLDAAPVIDRADALVTAAHATGVVLCVGAGTGTRTDVEAAIDVFTGQGTAVLGTVLTNTRARPARTAAPAVPPAGPARNRRGAAPATATRRR